jgi:hypothetical protein
MLIHLSASLVPLVSFTPLPASPDKKGNYHYDIDDHTYREKTGYGIFLLKLLNWLGLFFIGCECHLTFGY